MNDKIATGYSYCLSSRRRYEVVQALGSEDYLTPTNLAKKTKIPVNHISNLLRDLKDNNIVICINEEMRKGKLYKLTDFGRSLLPYLNNEKEVGVLYGRKSN